MHGVLQRAKGGLEPSMKYGVKIVDAPQANKAFKDTLLKVRQVEQVYHPL